jgi:hypothetical protein
VTDHSGTCGPLFETALIESENACSQGRDRRIKSRRIRRTTCQLASVRRIVRATHVKGGEVDCAETDQVSNNRKRGMDAPPMSALFQLRRKTQHRLSWSHPMLKAAIRRFDANGACGSSSARRGPINGRPSSPVQRRTGVGHQRTAEPPLLWSEAHLIAAVRCCGSSDSFKVERAPVGVH